MVLQGAPWVGMAGAPLSRCLALATTLPPPVPPPSEGWEQNGLYEFFRAKMRARRRKGQEKRNR